MKYTPTYKLWHKRYIEKLWKLSRHISLWEQSISDVYHLKGIVVKRLTGYCWGSLFLFIAGQTFSFALDGEQELRLHHLED